VAKFQVPNTRHIEFEIICLQPLTLKMTLTADADRFQVHECKGVDDLVLLAGKHRSKNFSNPAEPIVLNPQEQFPAPHFSDQFWQEFFVCFNR